MESAQLGDLRLRFSHARAGAADDAGETANQFTDAIGFVEEDGFARDEFLADAESRGTGEKILRGVLLRDAAAGDKRNVWKGSAQGADVIFAADHGARKNLHEI